MKMKFEYPLQWLPQQPRTKKPERARFQVKSVSRAGDYLADELRKLGATNCIISTNLQSKISGGFYANQRIEDAGVVIYFTLKDTDKAMACDRWDRAEHNLWALYLSISAIRGLERWGGSEFLDGLFTGFKALPAPGECMNMKMQYFSDVDNLEYLNLKYKKLLKELPPDMGGSSEDFQEMMEQYKNLKRNFERLK